VFNRMPRVLVTIPVWNEEHWIETCVRDLRVALATTPWSWQVAIAEDGSTDGTVALLERLHEEFPDLLVVSNPERMGRGLALRRLWATTDADVYVFLDADLASGTDDLLRTVQTVLDGEAVVTGSRYAPGADVRRPPVRSLVSLGYNRLARLLFQDGIRDHQCGLKAFSRDAVRILLPLTREDSWFWDTEVLVLASRLGIGVQELPIRWRERRVDRTTWRRLADDVYLHGTRILSLRGRLERDVASVAPLRPVGSSHASEVAGRPTAAPAPT
jgi:glycosyltransferase involved in cell wall biosynthesis